MTRTVWRFFLSKFVYVLIVLGASGPNSPLAAELPHTTAIPLKTTTLSSHSEWLALLHYEVTPGGKTKNSYVSTDSFFLSDEGRYNPRAELEATLQAFTSEHSTESPHPQCKFPARKLWLEQNAHAEFPVITCDDFDRWAELDRVDSISMVFATGHFASPASFFGHNFLKINRIDATSYLLDNAINFGALIPPNENPLTYLATGIFGGYEAEYSAEPFYRFLAKYGEKDLRDVWEYKLALSEAQRNLLIAHLWELQNVRFPYFFFRENCAYHISALLNLITTDTFVPRYMPWAMPITVFDNLMSSNINGKPLVDTIELHRSRRTLFQNRFAASSVKQKKLIHQYALGQVDLSTSNAFSSLTEDEQIWIVDTLLDYSAFMSKEKDGEVHKENQRQLLMQRLQLTPAAVKQPIADKSRPPHSGQRPSYTASGMNARNKGDRTAFVSIRPAYYDFMSLDIARKSHASFTIFDTQIKFDESANATIDKFDLVNLSNLNTQYSGIAIDKASSWQLRIGYEGVADACSDCGGWSGQWDIGKSKKLAPNIAAFALAGLSLDESRNRTANGALHATIGLTGLAHPLWRFHLNANYVESFNRHQPFSTSIELENRFGRSRWWDVRLNIRKRDELDTSLSVGLYW